MKKPLVSVMVPVYNGEATVSQAIASLLAQTFDDWEAVVVDDGSTDRTPDVLSALDDPRVRTFRFDENRGRGAARQLALEQSRGEFLGMLDADDWWYPWKLEGQVAFLEANGRIGAVSVGMAMVGVGGSLVGVRRAAESGRTDCFPRLGSLLHLRLPHAPTLLRRRAAAGIGYDVKLRRAEDWHFLARLLARVPYCAIGEILYAYTEASSVRGSGVVSRYAWSSRADLLLLRHFPVSASVEFGKNLLQLMVAVALGGFGVRRLLSRAGPKPATKIERQEYQRAWEKVDAIRRRLDLKEDGPAALGAREHSTNRGV